MNNENKEFETQNNTESANTMQNETETQVQDQNEAKESDNAAERLNSYLFAMSDKKADENGNTPNPETSHNKDSKDVKKLCVKIAAFALAFVTMFCGAFAGVSWVCQTSVLGDSEFFEALMAKFGGITENKIEVDYISGEYVSDTIALADKVKKSTVVIRVMKYDSSIYEYTETSSGSGVILEQKPDGTTIIVTNHHVVNGAQEFYVETYSGNKYPATIWHLDEVSDLALIKINATETLTPATMADSDKAVSGQFVIAAGNPLGLGMATSFGYVAANNRDIGDNGGTFLQLDISANPGNSGGGLYDGQGNLLGIITSKASGSNVDGIVYAIPSNRMLSHVNDLVSYGYVRGRAALGITIATVNESSWSHWSQNELKGYLHETPAKKYGVYIINSKYNTDILLGDRLISLNGQQIATNTGVLDIISRLSPGSIVTAVVERAKLGEDGTVSYEEKTYTILLRERDWPDEIK